MVTSSSTRILLAGSAILFLSIGSRQGFGLFMEPLIQSGILTREQFSFAVATQYLMWGIAGPIAGVYSQRIGAKPTLYLGAFCYVAGFLLASQSSGPLSFWLGAGVLIGLGLGGASFGVVHAFVAQAYPADRRGSALGLVGAVTAVGQLAMLVFTSSVLSATDWRVAVALHAAAVLGIWIFALFLPRGAGAMSTESAGTGSSSIRTVVTSGSFWLIAVPFGFSGFQVMATMTHLPAALADKGMSPSVSTAALLAVSGTAFLGSWTLGKLADRWAGSYVLSLVYFLRMVVTLIFAALPLGEWQVVLLFGVIGLLWMSPIPLTSHLTSKAFGTSNLASTFSLVFLGHQVGGFLGTWSAGILREVSGSYTPMWLVCAGLCGIGSIAAWSTRSYYLQPSIRAARSTA
jgi:predicted MFS family arabinose efflux permease